MKKEIYYVDERGDKQTITEVKTTIDREDGSKQVIKIHYENKEGKVIEKPDSLHMLRNITETGLMSETGENGKARGVSNR